MFKVFANRNFLEGVLLDKTPKNWYNIFMSGNVAEVYVPEDLIDENIDSMGATDIIDNLQLLGTTVTTAAEYINEIPQNPRHILENPNAVFLLDIEANDAKNIQNKYGVICQSFDAIDDEVLTKTYEYNLFEGQKDIDWSIYFDKSNHTLPSNALIICDRYIFSADAKSCAKVAQNAIELGLSNIRGILNSVLPKRYNDEYNVLIVFDSSTFGKNEEELEMFESIVANLKDYADSNKKTRYYKIRFDLISIDHNCINYKKLHNRRIISNYFVVRADYKLQAFKDNLSTSTQTIFYDALFSKIVPMKPSGPDSPIKSQIQTINSIRELIQNGNCRKYASIVDKQNNIDVITVCKACTNRLIL
ncbi:MAG: hypothetical protein J1F40_09040 [Prevotellaceae bacterium]|nr:hypothetical protein [Prevotellaceae bacterium]